MKVRPLTTAIADPYTATSATATTLELAAVAHANQAAHAGNVAQVGRHARVDRLLRTGHLLTASSVASSGLGAGYWVFVARWYSASDVGRGYSTISAMMFLAGFGQLNLANTLVRFVPSAGSDTLRLVRRVYLVAATTTALLATCFVIAVPQVSPQLRFLHSPGAGLGFVLAAAGYAVFVVQDGALTGLLRADWVLYENAVFALVKILLVIGLAAFAVAQGILVSWYASLLLALLVTNWFLFRRAIPGRAALPEPRGGDAARPTARYLTTDFAASMCWLVATTLMPVFVLDRLGAEQSAYFSLAWMVAYTLYMLSTNMGASLIVESAKNTAGLAANCHRILRHAGALLGVSVAVGMVAAPAILRIFGAGYAAHATGLLRLLLLSALPNLVVTAAVAVGRARRRVGAVVAILFSVCALALGLTAITLPRLGIVGAGYGWLIAQSTVATVLLVRDSWWLGPPPTRGRTEKSMGATIVRAAVQRARRAAAWPSDRVAAFRLVRTQGATSAAWRALAPSLHAVRTPSDLLVIRIHSTGLANQHVAIKVARTEFVRDNLARQQIVLTALRADERLGDWRALLPPVIACDTNAKPAWMVEGWLPGVSGSALLRERPEARAALTESALAAIQEFHCATGRRDRVGDEHLNRWLHGPARAMQRQLQLRRPGDHADALDALRDRVHRRLYGRVLTVGWVHRDYHPGNVLYARDGRRVSGIVDWGGAVPDGPTALDECLFGLAVRRETTGGSFGDLVIESLPADDDGLLLLTWLWHVSDNLGKSPRFMASGLWIRRNVLDVLDALKAVYP